MSISRPTPQITFILEGKAELSHDGLIPALVILRNTCFEHFFIHSLLNMLRLLKNLIEGEIVDQNKLNFCNHNIRCQIWSWLYPELSSAKV